jgi:hypothetical protein
MVDSGASYSVVPATTLRRLGIEPRGSRSVIFGEEDDAALLGIVSLEDLGLMLDPLKRVLRPLPMVLGGQART